jgi:drug/metabolite transporter (DMT)-like permease
MINIVAKLLSESLLSTYPTVIKKIDISFNLFLWTRMITCVLISAFFINWKTIAYYLTNRHGWYLSILTLINNYAAFKGIKMLEGGIAVSLIHTYPIFIVLFAKGKSNYSLLLIAMIGVILLVNENKESKPESFDGSFIRSLDSNTKEGLCYIVVVIITAVLIYFGVRKIDTDNNWNLVFISYIFGAIIMTLYINKDSFIKNKNIIENITNVKKIDTKNNYNKHVLIAFAFNGIIGTMAHYLRLYTVTRLAPLLYAVLSYFGIVMAYIYGIIFSNEVLTVKKVIGTLLIISSNIMALL